MSRVYYSAIGNLKTSKINEGTEYEKVLTVSGENNQRLDYKYSQWLPTWNPKDQLAFNHLRPFRHLDRGLFGDPEFKSLLEDKNVTYRKVSPKLGIEVEGIQLSTLTNKQKDDLALLVEKVGVVALKGQDFKNRSFDELREWGRYYGPLDVHANSGAPLENPEFHVVFKSDDPNQKEKLFSDSLNSIRWHSDVSYENQTPGITILVMLETGLGGDTQFIDSVELYNRFSPLLRNKLEGLRVLHSSREQANGTASIGAIQRKGVVDSIHPLIRYHPVLKKKTLFINNNFSRRFLGLKQEESDNLSEFLLDHSKACLDAHIRMQWNENTVVIWDNRRVIHAATADWDAASTRHAFRITTMAERPVETEEEYENWAPEAEKERLKLKDYYLNLSPAQYYEATYPK